MCEYPVSPFKQALCFKNGWKIFSMPLPVYIACSNSGNIRKLHPHNIDRCMNTPSGILLKRLKTLPMSQHVRMACSNIERICGNHVDCPHMQALVLI